MKPLAVIKFEQNLVRNVILLQLLLARTASDIDAIVHGHESFNPIQTANIDPISKKTIEALVHNKVVQKFGEAAWPQVKYIIDHESGFDPYIVNKSSGACGIV